MKRAAMLYKYVFLILFVVVITAGNKSIAQEVCNNGTDDDSDGLIDLFDPDCQCHFTVTGNLLQNGSFESYQQCPLTYIYDSEHNIASSWEFSSYTNINEANFYHNLNCPDDSAQILHMSPLLPMPNGTGFVGIYNSAYLHPIPEAEMMKGYVSQCLPAPLKAGEDYTLSFYAGRFRSWDNLTGNIFPFNVAVFGNTDCNAVPFGKKYVQGNGCPVNYTGWRLLGTTTLNSNGKWVQGKIHLTNTDNINVIAVGPDCSILPPINDLTDSTTFLDYHLYYLDDLHLLLTKDFPFEYIHVHAANNCSSLPLLEAPAAENASYQWYKDSIAIAGATNSTYQVTDTTKRYYNVSLTTGTKCITSEPFLVTRSKLNNIKMPADTALCSGDNLRLSPALDGIQYTINGLASNSVVIDKEGDYTITAEDINHCRKVFDTHVVKQNCADCDAYVPTAFTPNSDGLNDLFKATLRCFTLSFHVSIFNRWGNKIFESNNVNEGWDGTFDGRKMPQDSYIYTIHYKTPYGGNKTKKGIVVLLR